MFHRADAGKRKPKMSEQLLGKREEEEVKQEISQEEGEKEH